MVTHPMKPGTYTVSSGYGSRWGTFHAGLDFACPVGTPIYAPADGVVVQGKDRAQGSVSGFGSWIWLDCQASVGKDFIFGHVHHPGILVKAGDRVRAGQQIGVSGNEGQTTGPHLHFEVWGSPGRTGGKHQDPAPYFTAATAPGGTTTTTGGTVSTIFGIDVSEHQDGMSLAQAKREGMSFAFIRTTDGTYRDRCYRSHLDDAEGAGLITAAYHFCRRPDEGTSVAAQVDASLSVMGDARRPVWLDVETPGGFSGDLVAQFKAEFERRGVHVAGVYSYVPYWEGQMGVEPDSHAFGPFWVAGYPTTQGGAPASIYTAVGGDGAGQWSHPLGNQEPSIWQFTDRATVAGHLVDCSAFRGTQDDLRALFTGGTAAPTPSEEDDMTDTRLILDQMVGPERDAQGPRFTGWPGVPGNGGKTLVEAVAQVQADVAEIKKMLKEIR